MGNRVEERTRRGDSWNKLNGSRAERRAVYKGAKNSNRLITPQLEKLDNIRLHQSTQHEKLHLVM